MGKLPVLIYNETHRYLVDQMTNTKLIIGVIILIVVGIGLYLFLISPKYTDFDTCPNCSSNASFINHNNGYFVYYCKNCDLVYTITESAPQRFEIYKNDSELYKSVMNYLDSMNALKKSYNDYQEASSST
jgi:Zn-finger protein